MGLQSNIASDKRRPGSFQTFDDTSGSRGLIPVTRSVCCVGIKSSTGTQANATPVQVFNESEADGYFGKGSELALMVRKVYEELRKQGASCQVWACSVAAPAGVAATRTFTVTGTATAAGDVVFRIAGRTLRAAVKSGDTQNTIAASINSAIGVAVATGTLPVTASVATNVVTTTHANTGVNGNDVSVSVVSSPAGATVATASPVAGTGVASLVASLDALGSRDYLAIAVANHLAQDVTDLGTHMDAMWAAGRKRWRHAFIGETGTLSTATTLASGGNRKEIVISSCENSPSLPSELAATAAAISQSKDRPSYNYDGTETTLYAPPDASVFDDNEVEAALLGGVTPLTLSDTGAVKIERLVTTKATVSGAAFENLRDYAISATTAYYARQVDAKAVIAMKGKNADERLMNQLRDLALSILRQGEEAGDLHHVEDHAAELRVAAHPTIPSRVLMEVPLSVVPNAHQLDNTIRLFVEGA